MVRGPKRRIDPNTGKRETLAAFNKRQGKGGSVSVTNSDPTLSQIKPAVKAKRDVSTSVRNQIIRYFSDYISEEIPGFGKKTPNADKFRRYTGLTGDVSPDAEVDIAQFAKLTGIKLSQSKILKDSAAAAFETKVSGIGTGNTGISFTAVDVGRRGSDEFNLTEQQLKKIGKTNITGKEAYDFIFTNNLIKGKGNQLLKAIEAKFENLLVVNAYDTEKTGSRSLELRFVESPLAAVNLRDADSFTQYISLRIRPRTESSKSAKAAGREKKLIVSYRIEAVPTKKLTATWQYKDITRQVLKAHKGAFSTGARIYIQKRIQQYASDPKNRASKEKVKDLLAFTESLAQEFKEGGFTPLTMKTTLKPPKNLGLKEGKGALVGKTATESRPQRFISGVQLSQLVQKRLGQTMRKFGEPQTPDLTERSGTFRNSVNIIANYRKGVIMYYYNPIYDSLNKFGYKPSEQVGRATREVVQSLYARAFNIVKG